MPEKFNPKDEQYKKVDDLPKEHQEEFVDIPQEIGGGFVRKEAMEALTEAEKVATIVNALKEQGLTSTDVLHEQALPMEKKRENALVDGENFEEFANDKEVVLKAVKRDGYNLQYASPELKNDKEIVLEAIKDADWGAYIFQYASPELKNDKEFILEAIKEHGKVIQHISNALKSDLDVILAAIKQNPDALRFISKNIREQVEHMLK